MIKINFFFIKFSGKKTDEKMIIAFSGTHCTKKTTSAFNLAYQLKKQYPEKTIGLRSENVAFCPYPINQETTSEAQMWMFCNAIQADLLLLSCHDIVVSDRTVADYIAYTHAAGFHFLAACMLALAKNHIKNYKTIYLKTADEDDRLYDDGLRDVDPVFRMQIQQCIVDTYDKLGLRLGGPVLKFEGGSHG
jgi:thymidylate kinase